MNKILFIIPLIVSHLIAAHASFDSLWVIKALKLKNKGVNNIIFVKSLDSLLDSTGLDYDPSTKYTTFPEDIYFDAANAVDGILKKGSATALYLSTGGTTNADSGAWIQIQGYNHSDSGNLTLSSANNGAINLYAADGVLSSCLWFALYADTIGYPHSPYYEITSDGSTETTIKASRYDDQLLRLISGYGRSADIHGMELDPSGDGRILFKDTVVFLKGFKGDTIGGSTDSVRASHEADIADSATNIPPSGRMSSLYVAAKNSSYDDRKHANYLCDSISDQVQIQAAIDSVVNTPYGRGVVRLCSGTYALSATVNIKHAVSLIGEEGLYGVLIYGPVNDTAFQFTATAGDQGIFDLKNFTVLGGKVAICLTVDNVLGGYGPMDICIERVMGMSQTGTAFVLGEYQDGVGTAPIWGLRLINCLGEYATNDGFFICGSQCYVSNCFAANNHGSGFRVMGSSDILMNNNNSRGSDSNGIYFDCSRGYLIGNTIFSWNMDKVTPTSNRGACAIQAVGADRVSITNNIMQNATAAQDLLDVGVYLPPSGYYTTSIGNIFYGSSGHRINNAFYQSAASANSIIEGNSLNSYVQHLGTTALYNSAKIIGNNSNTDGTRLRIYNSTIQIDSLTANTALYADANKRISSSVTTATELACLSGVSSAIQDQFTGKIGGGGTANYFTKFTAEKTIGNSGLFDSTTILSLPDDYTIRGRDGNLSLQSHDTLVLGVENGNIKFQDNVTGDSTISGLNLSAAVTTTTQILSLDERVDFSAFVTTAGSNDSGIMIVTNRTYSYEVTYQDFRLHVTGRQGNEGNYGTSGPPSDIDFTISGVIPSSSSGDPIYTSGKTIGFFDSVWVFKKQGYLAFYILKPRSTIGYNYYNLMFDLSVGGYGYNANRCKDTTIANAVIDDSVATLVVCSPYGYLKDSSFAAYCSLYDNLTYRSRVLAYFLVKYSDSTIQVTIPALQDVVSGGAVYIRNPNIKDAKYSSPGPCLPVCMRENTVGFGYLIPASGYFLVKDGENTDLDDTPGGPFGCDVKYRF